jgi:hypothetical protein
MSNENGTPEVTPSFNVIFTVYYPDSKIVGLIMYEDPENAQMKGVFVI